MNPSVTFERIEDAYWRLGFRLNWGFLTCPKQNFLDPKTLLVTLNPGGGCEEEKIDPTWVRQKNFSQEAGSIYLVEDWDRGIGRAPLQQQIQGMFKFLNLPIEDVASANFVPFQSPTWNALENRERALEFSRELWRDLIDGVQPKLIIALGSQVVGAELQRLFGVADLHESLTGWGNVKVRYGMTPYEGRLVILPHLSRYALFNPDGSSNRYSPALREAFGVKDFTYA